MTTMELRERLESVKQQISAKRLELAELKEHRAEITGELKAIQLKAKEERRTQREAHKQKKADLKLERKAAKAARKAELKAAKQAARDAATAG